MKEFKVEITEYLQRVITVEADNKREAILKVKEEYDKGNIILDSNDFVTNEIEIYKDE